MILLDKGASVHEETFADGTNVIMKVPQRLNQDGEIEEESPLTLILHVLDKGDYTFLLESEAPEIALTESRVAMLEHCMETLKAFVARKYYSIIKL